MSPTLRRRKRPVHVVDVGEAGPYEMGISGTSTPVKGRLPIYSQRRSSLLGLPEDTDVDTRKRRVEFEVGDDEDTPLCGRVGVGELGRGEGRSVPETGSLGLSEMESFAHGLATQAHLLTISATLQDIPRELSLECQRASEAGMGTQRSSFYPSQSAKTLLKEFFELNPPTHLDPTHQTARLSSNQMIPFARFVGLEVVLASYGLLEDLLMKSGIENWRSVGPADGGRSHYPSQCGSTVVEISDSRSQYSLSTSREGIEESVEHFGGLAASKIIFAGLRFLCRRKQQAIHNPVVQMGL